MADKPRQTFYDKKYQRNLMECDRLRQVKKIFMRRRTDKILDIGCGDGSFSVLLLDSAKEVHGIDIAQGAVDLARKKNIRAVRADIDGSSLPFGDNSFDGICCGEILEHLFNVDLLLEEVHRILKPGGICVITVPNLSYWLNRIFLLFGFQPVLTEVSLKYNVGKPGGRIDQISGHIRNFTYRAMVLLLKMHKFRMVQTKGAGVVKCLPFPLNIPEWFFTNFASLAHTSIYVITPEK